MPELYDAAGTIARFLQAYREYRTTTCFTRGGRHLYGRLHSHCRIVGGPAIASDRALGAAALVRAAAKTLPRWGGQKVRLQPRRRSTSTTPSIVGWFPGDQQLQAGAFQVGNEIRKSQSSPTRCRSASLHFMQIRSQQRYANMPSYPITLQSVFEQRSISMFLNEAACVALIIWPLVFGIMERLGMHRDMRVMQTSIPPRLPRASTRRH